VNREIRIFPDAAAIAKRAADELLKSATAAVQQKSRFTIVLAGGSTPKVLYSLLVSDPTIKAQVPWDKMDVFFGDERHVGPEHSESNFRMANDFMISKSPLKPNQVHRIKGEYEDAKKAASEYEQLIRSHFKLADGEFPRFDVILLGMGNEGHTASLFPGTKALHADNRIVVQNWVGKLYTDRITLTARAINNAATVIFMITGSDKALALKGVLEGPVEPEQLPSQMIQPQNGQLLWLTDTTAGAMLSSAIHE
jgi:6-phosphogluconolactonase